MDRPSGLLFAFFRCGQISQKLDSISPSSAVFIMFHTLAAAVSQSYPRRRTIKINGRAKIR